MTREALADLIMAMEDRLYRVAKTILSSDADCEDAAQETVARAFARVDSLREDRYAETWLIRILMNECYAILRRQKKLISLEDYGRDSLVSGMEEPGRHLDLYQAVMKLPVDQRVAVLLFYSEGFSIKEIALIEDTTSDVSREESIQFAENLQVSLSDEQFDYAEIKRMETEKQDMGDVDEYDTYTLPAKEFEKNLHQVGEGFAAGVMGENGDVVPRQEIEMLVREVRFEDDINLLDPMGGNYDFYSSQIGEDGKLKPVEISFVHCGDGINSLDEVVKTETYGQKLVYLTVDYKNVSETTQDFECDKMIGLFAIRKEGDQYAALSRDRVREARKENALIDRSYSTSLCTDMTESLYDEMGVPTSNEDEHATMNMEPGETRTVHYAFLAAEDRLRDLYFTGINFDLGHGLSDVGLVKIPYQEG